MAGVVSALLLFLIYFNISLMDIWGFMPDHVQGLGYILIIVLSIYLLVRPYYKKSIKIDKITTKRLLIYGSISVILAIWSGDDFLRRAELAFQPRAIFNYPEATITATITPPLYLNQDSFIKNIAINRENNIAISPVFEGSTVDFHVENLKWQPQISLSDGQQIPFIKQDDGSFKASVEISDQIVWQLKQGSYTIGSWPVTIIDDQSPVITKFSLDDHQNDKGYLSLNVAVEDDYKIMNAAIIVAKNQQEIDRQTLSIRQIKSFNNIFYLDFSKSIHAGEQVEVILYIEDEAGQVTTASLKDIKLPIREFRNGISQKLVSIRKQLNEDSYDLKVLSRQIKALGLLSDKEGLPPVYYMALRSAYWRLVDPTMDNDQQIAKDILWDIALKIDDSQISILEKSLIDELDEVILAIKQKKSVTEIRENLRRADKLFHLYSKASMQTASPYYSLDIDVIALRKLYTYILTFSDQEKFYNAAIIADFMRKGLVYNDDLILSKEGLGRYFALTEGRKIIENLISIQKSLLATSYNQQMKDQLFHKNEKAKEIMSSKIKQDHIKLQLKIGDAVKLLGEKISFTGVTSDYLIQNATHLVEDIITSMQTKEINQVTRSQSELIAIMSSLKRLLNKPVDAAPQLQNIVEEINAAPVL